MKLLSIITNYGAGQIPELSRCNKKSLNKAITDALNIGRNHHKADLINAAEYIVHNSELPEPQKDSVLKAANIADEILYHLKTDSNWKVEVAFASNERPGFKLEVTRAHIN